MPPSVCPRRSAYMPGSKQPALEKAQKLAADALIFDLEDAVAADAKATARGTIAPAIGSEGHDKREPATRHALGTPWGREDPALLRACRSMAYCCPLSRAPRRSTRRRRYWPPMVPATA